MTEIYDSCITPTSQEINTMFAGKRTVLCEDPMVFTIDNYLTDAECEHFINVSKDNLKRAFVSDTKTGMLSNGRTGSNYWLRHNTDAVTNSVGQRISKEVGIPLENAEAYQVVAYDETQKYSSHYDSYVKNSSEKCRRCLKYGGQRMVTALIYLCDVEEGGHTRFDKLDINVHPVKGRLLVFHNTLPGTNTVHPMSLHAGTPVLKGYKYAANLWFREISMTKLYDFPFLNESAVDESVSIKIEEDVEVNNIDINSSGQDSCVSVVSKDPVVSHFSNALTKNECKYIVSKCTDGSKQLRGRTGFWVNLADKDMSRIGAKISGMIGLKNIEFFENINVILYPDGCDHGCHHDAFDLTTPRGKEFSKVRGQRLFTIACLLDDATGSKVDSFTFRHIDKDVSMSIGDMCVYKNFGNSDVYQRDERVEYALNPVQGGSKHYMYLFVREKTRTGESIPVSMVNDIEERLQLLANKSMSLAVDNMISNDELKVRMDSLMSVNVDKVDTTIVANDENYYTTLEHVYDTYKTTGNLKPYRKLGFRRHNSPLDAETIEKLYDIRRNYIRLDGVHSLLNPSVLDTDYVHDEFTPVSVNNVFTEEASKLIKSYFGQSIANKKFEFGDRQSQRWKAYDDFMSRIMQFEVLPLIERITKKRLQPTYTYLSCYDEGADLPAHTDRAECEFTVSFVIDKPEGSYWPIYVDMETQPIKHKGRYRNYVNDDHKENCVKVDCDANGLMVFCGTDHIHFRESLPHEYYYISLLHFMSY